MQANMTSGGVTRNQLSVESTVRKSNWISAKQNSQKDGSDNESESNDSGQELNSQRVGVHIHESQESNDNYSGANQDPEAKRSRKDNGLVDLTKKFIDLLKSA